MWPRGTFQKWVVRTPLDAILTPVTGTQIDACNMHVPMCVGHRYRMWWIGLAHIQLTLDHTNTPAKSMHRPFNQPFKRANRLHSDCAVQHIHSASVSIRTRGQMHCHLSSRQFTPSSFPSSVASSSVYPNLGLSTGIVKIWVIQIHVEYRYSFCVTCAELRNIKKAAS